MTFFHVLKRKTQPLWEENVKARKSPDIDTQMTKILRGVEEVISEEELRSRLKKSLETGKPLRVKLGVDPTASDIHLGHMVTIRKLKHFQELGHIAIFLVGDFTARIGDPTQRSEVRVRLTKEKVWEHARTFNQQVFKILDEEKTELRNNGEWFDSMSFADCLDLAYRSTVARMLERNDFAKRFRDGNPISITEFLYPLMQGYDSVALKCDIELGGTDQKFNLLAGRDMQMQFDQAPQIVMMTPLIEGLDGSKKMSKTEGNYIAVDDTGEDMFGKTMSIQDDLIVKYFTLLTDVAPEEIRGYERALTEVDRHQDLADPLHPMQIKKALARSIVTEYHSAAAANEAAEHFEKVVQRKEIPDNVPLVTLPEPTMQACDVVAACASVSKAEARRLLAQGAVRLDGIKLSDPAQQVAIGTAERILQVGKRKYFRVTIARP
jgi:tyrosyl-tRNA synthetase